MNILTKIMAVFASIMWVILCVIFVLWLNSEAHATPEEPPLSELHRWYPTPDGTVILEYRIIDKNSVQIWRFKHAQKGVAGKFPSCNEASIRGDEIRLITQEPRPSLYFIKKESDGSAPEFSLDFTYDLW